MAPFPSCLPTTATAPVTQPGYCRRSSRAACRKTLIVTVADRPAVEELTASGLKAGDPFDRAIGGLVDAIRRPSGPYPGHGLKRGSRRKAGGGREARDWIQVAFGDGNVLVLSPYLAQILEPSSLQDIGLDPAAFDIIAIKSRVHFRRGFDDTGFAKTILLVEPPEPFLGTVRLDGLHYDNVTLSNYYPYSDLPSPSPSGRGPG